MSAFNTFAVALGYCFTGGCTVISKGHTPSSQVCSSHLNFCILTYAKFEKPQGTISCSDASTECRSCEGGNKSVMLHQILARATSYGPQGSGYNSKGEVGCRQREGVFSIKCHGITTKIFTSLGWCAFSYSDFIGDSEV